MESLIFLIVKEEIEKCDDIQEARETVIEHFDTVNLLAFLIFLNSSNGSLKKG